MLYGSPACSWVITNDDTIYMSSLRAISVLLSSLPHRFPANGFWMVMFLFGDHVDMLLKKGQMLKRKKTWWNYIQIYSYKYSYIHKTIAKQQHPNFHIWCLYIIPPPLWNIMKLHYHDQQVQS